MNQPRLFFAFANDKEHSLISLVKEADEIRNLLTKGEKERNYLLYFEKAATQKLTCKYLLEFTIKKIYL